MTDSNWSFSQEFLPRFHTSRTDLESRIESASSIVTADALEILSKELAKLTKTLLDATGSLPAYDQRQCELQLQGLENTLDALRSSLFPHSKFSFKRKVIHPPDALSSATPTPTAPRKSAPPSAKSPINTPCTTDPTSSFKTHRYLTSELLSDSLLSSNLEIFNVDGCIVNLLPSTLHSEKKETFRPSNKPDISALHIRDVTNTILLLPVVKGSVLLHNISSCIVVVCCHQFRMHNSDNVNVYLSTISNPIIEHSTGIRFAPYPESFLVASDDEPNEPLDNFSVQDFSHIRATPSPNWSILAIEKRIESWPQSVIQNTTELDAVLEMYLPTRK